MTDEKLLATAREVLKIEAEGILHLVDKVDDSFAQAVNIIYRSTGRVIITGIGKSGLIGKKIVATLTSTGTQAIFLHPVEGIHGDLGIVTKDDVVIAMSNSGETNELNLIVSAIHQIGTPIIALTGNLSSQLARSADVTIDVGVEKEACPFGLAPTSSTTAALAMGDALAVALIEKREFKESDFFRFHPGGNLGLRLRAKVGDVMITGRQMPMVTQDATALTAIEEMDIKNKGFVLVTDGKNRLAGILTDGDLRRLIRKDVDFKGKKVEELMTGSPKTIEASASLAETIEFMQRDEITTLAVVDKKMKLQGYIHLHDILGRGGSLKISLP
ncbi:MAG: KpsF/GutQ family sugar-phosphate isomerase [Deltaproteobacteria bacterium]|nr:KpsF/GutQ family sugar-phosphate isomerase [Deltaproteobacteria bacterium]